MTPGYVAISRFRVRNGMENEVIDAFRARPHSVDTVPGFIRMDVISPAEDATEFWLVTMWTDEDSFRSWHHGHTFHDAHSGIPKGLKLDPTATQLRSFNYIAS